jgi:diaminopimelate epimerase
LSENAPVAIGSHESGEGMSFSKMSGAGNDFVVIDNRANHISQPALLARQICTRRASVGGDGLILVEESERASIRMVYFNADGSRADFCANGTRCAARFAFLEKIAGPEMTLETDAGLIVAMVRGTLVTLDLPQPRDLIADRPLALSQEVVRGASITIGVPHYVLPVAGELWSIDIATSGAALRNHRELQPAGANINFIKVRDRHSLEIRTYERGVEGETLSCGSGVVAAVSVSALAGRVESPVRVLTRSGTELEVGFVLTDGLLSGVTLTGDARLVFRAEVGPETISGFDPAWVRDATAVRGAP